jgi:hypothetical protein
MSTTVNALINDAYQKCSLCGNGQSVSGNEAMVGLRDLMSVIAELSSQNLALSDVEIADVHSNGIIRIMQELPDGWEEVDELPLASSLLVGKVRKYEDKVYGCQAIPGTYEFKWVERADIKWPDLIINPLPDRVTALTRKLGERYISLFPAEKQLLDSKTKRGLPSFYMCETQLEKVKVENIEYNYEVFIIETDSIQSLNYRITYLKAIPQYKLNDRLYFSEKVLSVIEDGLCAKLCLRYKLTDIKSFFDEEYANGLRLLKRINQANRPMTYNFVEGGSYLDNYYNGFSPSQW